MLEVQVAALNIWSTNVQCLSDHISLGKSMCTLSCGPLKAGKFLMVESFTIGYGVK